MFGVGRGVKVGQAEERENDKICPEPTELDAVAAGVPETPSKGRPPGRIRAAPTGALS